MSSAFIELHSIHAGNDGTYILAIYGMDGKVRLMYCRLLVATVMLESQRKVNGRLEERRGGGKGKWGEIGDEGMGSLMRPNFSPLYLGMGG